MEETESMADRASLPTRPFGKTGMNITRVGLGTWAIGGPDWAFGWGEQDDAVSIATIRHALDRGVNWIDTAAVYGLGHAEQVVGRALRDIPQADRPYVFTKCSLVWDESDHAKPPRRDGSAASLRRELEASLRRLQLERFDLYQMHWPTAPDGAKLEEYWQTLLDMKREGKVRAVGLSNHNVAQLEAAERLGHVDTLQPPFSAIVRQAAAAELPWCAAHQTGVICYSPMQLGLLSGSFSPERVKALPKNDWRSREPEYNAPVSADFSGEPLRRNLALADALKPIAARHGVTQAAVAVAWTLAWPGLTAAICGARRPAQVDGWLAAGTLELSQADLREIADAIARTGAGTGPAMPPRG
jgi:aryl-alcohol dehydrogenase-like predicted oxidoreductase